MGARAAFKQDEVSRAVKGVKAAGLPVRRVVFINGGFEVVIGDPDSDEPGNPLDTLLNGKKA